MQCVSQGHIDSASVLLKFSCHIMFFFQFLLILSKGLEQVTFSNIIKMGKIQRVLSKLRLTM